MVRLWKERSQASRSSALSSRCPRANRGWCTYVNDVKDHLKEGQEVKVKVIGIDENGRINLSIKKAMDPPPRPAGHGGQGRPGGRPGGFNGGFRGKPAPAEPTTFEDRLKQFMASSDSKLSELRQAERRSSRRGGRK